MQSHPARKKLGQCSNPDSPDSPSSDIAAFDFWLFPGISPIPFWAAQHSLTLVSQPLGKLDLPKAGFLHISSLVRSFCTL